MIRTLCISLVFSLFGPLMAAATIPDAPSLKPPRTFTSDITDAKNAEILTKALDAAERSNWNEVARLQRQATDPSVRNLIMWKRASEGVPGMSFGEVSGAMDALPDWPHSDRMRKRAEEIIEESALSPQERIAWLTNGGPRTGAGKIALANSYMALGETAKAIPLVKSAWANNSLSDATSRAVLSRYGNMLTQDDHRARVEFLLWTNQRSDAAALKSKLTADWRALVDARIALAGRRRNVDRLVNAVPDSLQNNPGLLYERARWRRKAGNQEGATPLLAMINGKDVTAAGRGKLWDERNIAARTDLKDGNWSRAYQLTAPHGLSSGSDFAAAEWSAGWIALRLNGQPERGLEHFQKMRAGVSSPISASRGDYWIGRAADVLKQPDLAKTAYEAAAVHKTAYYGQLAAERLGDRKIAFTPGAQPTDEQVAAFNARPMVKALRLLGETGQRSTFRSFAYHLDDLLDSETDYLLLAKIADEYQVPDIGVRGAKAGLAKGIVSPDAAYPVVNYPLRRQPNVERAMVLALTRQESEMNPRAMSHANAYGLMQFIPATARNEARLRGLPYQKSWLTDDPGYNMTLGGLHLDTLLDQFDGSYIMTAAAYNAGPSRPRQWVEDYGDPRKGQIDPIDWVEFIPFSETRNYVQRVLENTQIYRHRLSGQPEDITLTDDLKRGQ